MPYSLIVSGILSQIINSWPNSKLLNYNYLEQLRDILPSIAIASGMGICVYFVGFLPLPIAITLMIQIIAGAIIYIGAAMLLKLEEFEYLLGMVESFIKK